YFISSARMEQERRNDSADRGLYNEESEMESVVTNA
ncbi:MAG: hypothetical protein ACI9CZ_001395, partial [Flavobacterium sp.]